ncbi:ATPase family AAA domain-containing protein 3B [Colletotrichum trifolii]|uniref:ATPase family AAA domain-containing protein 3B n=1 Tax=Colletotrichum trifolii TaxID=5466 RepID=A0A4R8RCU7_COLTR|nr:ATPase family AAA domain-containing protein 3B [Colletotrichum trifolii]
MAENEHDKPVEPVRLTPPPEETEQASEDGLRMLDIGADAAIPDGESNKPRIGYRTEYRNRETNAIVSEHVHEKDFEPGESSSDEPIFEFVDGLVMIDLDAYYEAFASRKPRQQDESDLRNWLTDCACNVCHQQKKDARPSEAVFTKYKNESLESKMDDVDLALFPAALKAYVFRTRVWELVYVNQLSDPQFDEDMIDNLVMTEQRLATLKALSKSFARVTREGIEMKQAWWSADFVSGKGNGLFFLLHGKPGVGRTCTAECISQFTRRPLMILTSSDIGTSPEVVERNLTSNFKRASRWGAVLLIDEADIFMERRSTSDLTRNSLVAGFLRALEFYDGILFLTTNRVGSFDDAFISRIHVQLYYPDFTDDERQRIWKTFIDKLARERGDTMRLTIDAKEYIESMRKQGIKWNGREIRNAFQTAVALAEYDAEKDSEGRVKVTDNHLRAVVELSKDFKGYLDDLHTRDEGKRARQRMERLDSYEANSIMFKLAIVLLATAAAFASAAPEAVGARQAAGCDPAFTVCREGSAWCCYTSSSCYQFAPPVDC